MRNEELCDWDGRGGGGVGGIFGKLLIFTFRCVRKIAKSDYKLRHVCLSIRTGKYGSHRTDFHEIYLSIFRKPAEKIKVSLKSDKGNGYFT